MKENNWVLNEREAYYWNLQERLSKIYRIPDLEAVRVVFGLLFTFGGVEAQVEKRLQDADMTMPGLNVLVLLSHGNPDGYQLSELSDHLLSSRANITGVIDSLARRDLVERTSHPSDRRVVIAKITRKGRAWLDGYFPGHAKMMCSFAATLSTQERKTLLDVLAKMRGHMMSQAKKAAVQALGAKS